MKSTKDTALEIQEQHRNPTTPQEVAENYLANMIYHRRTKPQPRKK